MKINGKPPLSNNGSEMDDAGFVLFFTVKFLYLSNCTHLSTLWLIEIEILPYKLKEKVNPYT
jgi:hypothetical protein